MTSSFSIVPAESKVLLMLLPLGALIAGLLLLFGYIGYSSRHVRFDVDNQALHIRGDLYGRDIELSDLVLDQARVVDLDRDSELRPSIRTNGTGLSGYRAGWFRLRNGEKALLFVTDENRVAYVPTLKGYNLLLSVSDPQGFLNALKQHSH